jgi:hypothetical protein
MNPLIDSLTLWRIFMDWPLRSEQRRSNGFFFPLLYRPPGGKIRHVISKLHGPKINVNRGTVVHTAVHSNFFFYLCTQAALSKNDMVCAHTLYPQSHTLKKKRRLYQLISSAWFAAVWLLSMCTHFVPAITHTQKKKEAIPIDQQRLICCGMIIFFCNLFCFTTNISLSRVCWLKLQFARFCIFY